MRTSSSERLSSLLRLLLVLPLALALAACDSNDDTGGGGGPGGGDPGGGDPGGNGPGGSLIGQSTVQVTEAGPANASFTGGAFFQVHDREGEPFFQLDLYSAATAESESGLSERVRLYGYSERLGTGTYPLNDPSEGRRIFASYTYMGPDPADYINISAHEGTLTITSSSDSRLEGSFTFTGSVSIDQETGTVTGSFEAPFLAPDELPPIPGRGHLTDAELVPGH